MIRFADQLHILPLAAQPHVNAFSKNLGLYRPPLIILFQDAGGREAVQDGFDGQTSVPEADGFQLATAHKLHPFAEVSLLEAVCVRRMKAFPGFLEMNDAVYPVDGGEEVIWIFKDFGFVNVAEKAYQIEIVFGE